MLKNRASAERSRQRKQGYIDDLESKLSAVLAENVVLQAQLDAILNSVHMTHQGQGSDVANVPSDLKP